MRIPLDYYRILGLPIQATTDQLQQAHRDRTLQLPRREYSEAAISARRQLLDEAYAVLSDPEQRQSYDASFLAKSYELDLTAASELGGGIGKEISETATEPSSDPYTPSIEIQDQQLVGALLVLLELGEYELVLKLGRPYLSSGKLSLKNGRFGEPGIVLADIVLTVALACLELGREQWQQGQYENAAESLETGQELLLREGLFASVRGEMQADLFKLRPYRILELLALPEQHDKERRKGLALLQDMLQDRSGIDGTGDDQSGLNIDDFLRFIQQLRDYLTAAEQQTLFEAEARRPSAVATYLAVYALLARGFAERQPALIRRAKLMLIRLGTRQDVHLEQAVCALLLGQTEEASRALELSQEYESLAFIREHSQGAPDLLPGLCLYGERWLQNEVFPHFRDLAQQKASLKDYFADPQVQAYLEELPNEPESTNQWSVAQRPTSPWGTRPDSTRRSTSISPDMTRQAGHDPSFGSAPSMRPAVTLSSDPIPTSNGVSAVPTAERIARLSPEGRLNGAAEVRPSAKDSTPRHGSDRKRAGTNGLGVPTVDPLATRRQGSSGRRSPRLDRVLFLIVVGLLSVGILGFVVSKAFGVLAQLSQVFAPGPTLTGEQLQIQLDQPPLSIPDASTPITTAPDPNAPLTTETSATIIEAWLNAKSEALGSTHNVETLSEILTEPALSQWRTRAETARQDNWYWEYQSPQLQITGVEVSPSNPNQAQVDVEVTESANLYENGQLNVEESYDSDLRARYDLIRQDGKWLIQDMELLP